MQIIATATKATAVAALLALAGLLPANAGGPISRERPILVSTVDVQAPSNDQVVDLADRTMRVFMQSVREKSMQALWNYVSQPLQAQYSVAQLDDAFRSFYSASIATDQLKERKPIVTAGPTLDGNGHLIVGGYYTTAPSRISFHLEFTLEGQVWKVVGINVGAKPTTAASN